MSSSPPSPPEVQTIDRRRYRRLVRFFLGVFVHVFWHDVVLGRPLLRLLRRRTPLERWCELARRYRTLALRMGGVLIKLGQYLSARVDILPIEVTTELAGLQDEVPPADFGAVRTGIEADFGQPLDTLYAEVDPAALGAASLAQVHRARLLDGRPVVVKVLRPGIEVLVETDLRAIGLAIGWLKRWRFVRQRVDLDWLIDEFATTTRNELDLRREGRNAERFAADFADDDTVRVPTIEWSHTARRTLTEENVAYLKVADVEALERAGIDRPALAKVLYRLYMRQIFVTWFVHADPHPGNLFVKPLAGPDDPPDFDVLPGEPVPPGRDRPFELIFIDFGMVAEIPERLREALRDYIIGMGNRDAAAVIQSYAKAGILLPGADLKELEAALDAIFDRFWGVEMSRLSGLVRREAANLWQEFRQLLLETPVQLQVDLLFATRAIELLAGVATRLDPDFNLWTETMPFARKLALSQGGGFAERLGQQAQMVASLPVDTAKTMAQAQRGQLTVRSALAPDTRRQLDRLERGLTGISRAVALTGMLVAGALLYPHQFWAGVGLMGVAGLGLFVTWLRSWWR